MEGFRPLSKHDIKMHKLRTEPRAYEYLKLPGLEKAMEAPPQAEKPGLGLLLLAMLGSLLTLPEREEAAE